MIKQYTILLLLLFLLTGTGIGNNLYAQVTDTVIVEAPVEDSTAVIEDEEYVEENNDEVIDTLLQQSYWTYPADSIAALREEKDFSYIKNLDSLLKRRQELAKREEKKLEPAKKQVNVFPFIQVFLWTLLIAALLFILYRIFLSDRGLFTSPARNKKLEIQEEHLTDGSYLDRQLQDAVKAGNYRLAIRFMYLQSLSKLAERNWLQLSPDKTNYQYVRELTKPQLKNTFARITLHYEYAWYGDFGIEAAVFEAVKKEFDQFHQTIKQS